MTPRIAVLGGGVSAITSALVLRLLGADVRVFAARRADRVPPGERPARFASLHPGALVAPHSIDDARAGALTQDSLPFFETLWAAGALGVRRLTHWELSERPEGPPETARAMPGFAVLPSDGAGEPLAPRRGGAEAIHGWRFETYHCATPLYLAGLFELFEALGGTVSEGALTADAFLMQPADAFVDCAGSWGPEIFGDDPERGVFIRGHWLKAEADAIPLGHDGRPFSYNYRPYPDVYPRDGEGREGGDVYCYAREDGIMLGGSRQRGRYVRDPATGEARWQGEDTHGPVRDIAGVRVPAAILDLNRELLLRLSGIDIAAYPMTAHVGLRFVRDTPARNLRLERGDAGGRVLVHNYGHGGAGVTLSWGCALSVARLIEEAGISIPGPGGLPDIGMRAGLVRMLARVTRDRFEG